MNAVTRISIAAAAAALFSVVAVPAVNAEESTSVKCTGINGCKGQSKCATAENACAGQNSCKGKGWLPTATAEECTKKGGKVM